MTGVRFGASLTYLGVYLVAVLVGRLAVPPGSGLALFWPAAGVAALWMLRGTTRDQVTLDALLLFLVTTAVNLAFDATPLSALCFGLANLVQGYVVRLVLALLEHRPVGDDLEAGVRTARDLWQLARGSIAAALLSAPLGATGAFLGSGHWTVQSLITWSARNACGTFVVGAAVLAIVAARRDRPPAASSERRGAAWALVSEPRPHVVAELVSAVTLTLVAGVTVFATSDQLPVAFLVIATSAWIGFRFAPAVGGVHILVFGGLAVVLTVEGLGPFGVIPDLTRRAIVVQLFVAVTAVITLMLSLGVAERGRLLLRLRESEAHARARAALLDAVTTAMVDGLAVVDSRGRVLLSNPAAAALAGTGGEDGSLGRPDRELFWPDGSEISAADLPHQRALAGETVPPTDVLRIDPATGVQHVLSMMAVPLPAEAGDEPVAVLLIHDVTHERMQTRELEAFAGVVAHDLKNPLTALMSWSEVLDDQLDQMAEDASAARSSLVKIYRSADRMHQLINDLLTLSRARSGELRPTRLLLDDLVEEIARDVTEHHGFGLAPRVEHGELGPVRADETLVRQVLTNLFANAVKYVAEGVQPVVRVSTRPRGEMVEIQVSDNGVGIPAHEQGQVFDTFFRSSRTVDYPGTGLGLAICARAVERHGGVISARSVSEGTGTVITFTLPTDAHPLRAPVAPGTAAASDATGSEPAQRAVRTTSADPPPRRTGSDTAVS